jgi:prophage regulatory protein
MPSQHQTELNSSVHSKVQMCRIGNVCRITGLSKPTIYRLIRRGEFPQPVRLSLRASGWLLSDVESFVLSRQAG